jgi:hypothetical protein
MKYKIVDNQVAQQIASTLLAGESVDFAQYDQEIGKGSSLSESALKGLAEEIRRLKKNMEKKKGNREELDRQAFELIHRRMPNDPDMLGDIRFWVRFALVHLFDVITWRFPGKGGGGFNLENLGVSSSTRGRLENYPYKLWVRGELSRASKGKDPYRLGRYGKVDFWTSHIHRQGFTKCRSIASEFIQFQYPDKLKGKPRLWEGEEEPATAKFGIRTLVKRIKRMWATVEYTLLDPAEAQRLLKELSRGLKGPDGKPVSP